MTFVRHVMHSPAKSFKGTINVAGKDRVDGVVEEGEVRLVDLHQVLYLLTLQHLHVLHHHLGGAAPQGGVHCHHVLLILLHHHLQPGDPQHVHQLLSVVQVNNEGEVGQTWSTVIREQCPVWILQEEEI